MLILIEFIINYKLINLENVNICTYISLILSYNTCNKEKEIFFYILKVI